MGGSGKINKDEFTQLKDKLSECIDPEYVNDSMKLYENDGNNQVQVEEFILTIKMVEGELTKEELEQIDEKKQKEFQMRKSLKKYDTDKSGKISKQNLAKFLKKSDGKTITEKDISLYMKNLDDGNGELCIDTFIIFIKSGKGELNENEQAKLDQKIVEEAKATMEDNKSQKGSKGSDKKKKSSGGSKDLDKQSGCDVSYENQAKKHLTKKELKKLKKIFKKYDANNNGTICKKEMKPILQGINAELDRKQIRLVMEQYDDNDDGVLDFAEFCNCVMDKE